MFQTNGDYVIGGDGSLGEKKVVREENGQDEFSKEWTTDLLRLNKEEI